MSKVSLLSINYTSIKKTLNTTTTPLHPHEARGHYSNFWFMRIKNNSIKIKESILYIHYKMMKKLRT
jgi:hypothetical protein